MLARGHNFVLQDAVEPVSCFFFFFFFAVLSSRSTLGTLTFILIIVCAGFAIHISSEVSCWFRACS